MSRLVAIDPGKDMLGISWWDDGRLIGAGWHPVGGFSLVRVADAVVMEKPRARTDTPGGIAGFQALIDISISGALHAGVLVGTGASLRLVFPDEWKGGTRKPKTVDEPYVVELRCQKILTPEEWKKISWPSAKGKRHNVADAVGLGLFALGRCGRGVTSR